MDYSPRVLRNLGIEVKVAKLGDDGLPVIDDEGDYQAEGKFVRFTSADLAAIEEAFDGYKRKRLLFLTDEGDLYVAPPRPDDWPDDKVWQPEPPPIHPEEVEETLAGLAGLDAALEDKPFAAIGKVLGIIWKMTPQALDAILIPDENPDYKQAVTSAFAIATGTDPSWVGKYLALQRAKAEEIKMETRRIMREAMEEESETSPTTDSPGETGSEPGQPPNGHTAGDEPSLSSGKAARVRSASSSKKP